MWRMFSMWAEMVKSVSKVLGQMWALLALGWVSQDF